MTPKHSKPAIALTAPATAGALLILREAVFYGGFIVLNVAIDWPASLGLPAAEIFAMLRDKPGEIFAGYYIYMASSLLFIPIACALRGALRSGDRTTDLVLDVAVGFAIASAVFRTLGIMRWLFAMPALSQAYFDPAATEATRAAALLHYQVLDAYAGQIGEHLGVHLTAFGFLGCVALALFRTPSVSKVWAIWAAISALLFFPIADLLGVDGGMLLFVNGLTYSVWAMVFGVWLIRMSVAAEA